MNILLPNGIFCRIVLSSVVILLTAPLSCCRSCPADLVEAWLMVLSSCVFAKTFDVVLCNLCANIALPLLILLIILLILRATDAQLPSNQ